MSFVGNTKERTRNCDTRGIHSKAHKRFLLVEGPIGGSCFFAKAGQMEELHIPFNYNPIS